MVTITTNVNNICVSDFSNFFDMYVLMVIKLQHCKKLKLF